MKYKDWLDVWFANYIEPSSKTKTCERYLEIIEKHLKVKLGEYELEELSPIVIQKYITELMQSGNLTTGKGLAANSVNGIIVMIESCIDIGLIPSNDEYENYFYRSVYSAVITDENLSVIYDSEKSISTDKNLLGRAAKSPVMIDENTRLSAEKIHGGYTFRIEDLSKVNEINAALSETNERLSEENYIIEAENELKEQKAQIAEQNKLYAKTDEVTCEELKRLDALLSDMYHKTQLNSAEYIDKMRFACILAAYIKRRSNLVILAEKQENIDV